jgi:hypothetical protein
MAWLRTSPQDTIGHDGINVILVVLAALTIITLARYLRDAFEGKL